MSRTRKPVINTLTRDVTFFWDLGICSSQSVGWQSEGWSWPLWQRRRRWQGRPITWIHKDGPLVFGRIHSYSLQLRPSFPTVAFNKLLLKLPVRLVYYATSLVVYEVMFSLDELPCYSSCNSNVHNCSESLVKSLPHGWSRRRLGRTGRKTRKVLVVTRCVLRRAV